jgi:uncharacterized membrane protein YheB (UPF0754 family)
MRIFTINDRLSVVCQSLPTRTAFKHVATLMINGSETAVTTKICYQNRTWERFTFESVLEKLLDNMQKFDWITEQDKLDYKMMIAQN